MEYDDLIGMPWEEIPVSERGEALRRAYSFGRDAAEIGIEEEGAEGLIDAVRNREHFFYTYVITDEQFSSELPLHAHEYWDLLFESGEFVRDPRIPRFVDGWRHVLEEEELKINK